MSQIKTFFMTLFETTSDCTAEARQGYQEYLDRFPWDEHAPEALAALERLGDTGELTS
jgi:hypothetical protein